MIIIFQYQTNFGVVLNLTLQLQTRVMFLMIMWVITTYRIKIKKSPIIETLGNNFDYQRKVFHIPETQVCVDLKSSVLQGQKLNSDKFLTIKNV